MKQTAVTWLEKKIDNLIPFQNELIAKEFNSFFEQAKAMEKRQIIEARVTAPLLSTFDKADYKEEAEQYYAETFGKD